VKYKKTYLENGRVKYVRIRESANYKPPENASMSQAEPKHVGGGYYALPNGERVKGKEDAYKAMQE